MPTSLWNFIIGKKHNPDDDIDRRPTYDKLLGAGLKTDVSVLMADVSLNNEKFVLWGTNRLKWEAMTDKELLLAYREATKTRRAELIKSNKKTETFYELKDYIVPTMQHRHLPMFGAHDVK